MSKAEQPSLEIISHETLEYNFDKTPFKGVSEKVLSLLPSTRDQRIVFILHNTNTAIANAIRRTLMCEVSAKSLDFDISTIDTNEPYIKPGELHDRISLIPLDQDIADDVTFTIKVANQDPRVENHIVLSKDIVQVGGKKLTKLPFGETFRLIELQPGRYLRIPEIRISKGYGFQHARYQPTCDVGFRCIDYMQVTFVNSRGNFVKMHVKVSELVALMKKFKINIKHDNLWDCKVVVIPNKAYQNMLRPVDLQYMKKFDYIVENPNVVDVKDVDSDDTFLRKYSSAEAAPQEYKLSVRCFGNIDPKMLMVRTCQNIQFRLETIYELLQRYIKDKDVSSILHVQEDAEKTQIQIKGEDHTIGQLMITHIYELDNSTFVKKSLEHPLNRTVIVELKHAQALKLVGDALQLAKSRFAALEKSFTTKK